MGVFYGGRGRSGVYLPFWLAILAFPFICMFYAVVAVVWLLAHIVAGIILGVVWLVQRGVEAAQRRG